MLVSEQWKTCLQRLEVLLGSIFNLTFIENTATSALQRADSLLIKKCWVFKIVGILVQNSTRYLWHFYVTLLLTDGRK